MAQLDLFIAGAQKAGTTSLKNYLGEHPQIAEQLTVELDEFTNSSTVDFNKLLKKYFPNYKAGQRIVAKHVHLYKSEEYVRNLYKHNPACKIVFIVRDPVQRLCSAFQMAEKDGWVNFTLEDILAAWESENKDEQQKMLTNIFINLGMYSETYQVFDKYFPREQIMWVDFADLKSQPKEICSKIFKWLEIDTAFSPNLDIRHNEGGEAKSASLGKIVHWIRNEKNPIKKLIKVVVPYKYFVNISYKILKVTTQRAKPKEYNIATLKRLNEKYQPFNKQFSSLTGVSVKNWGK